LPGKHISKLEVKSGGFVDAIVTEGTAESALYWHQQVQAPHIAGTARVDRNWNWPRLMTWTSLLEKLLGRRAVFFQLNCAAATGSAFPVGQILVSDGYPFLSDHHKRCIFLWYLAGAPADALKTHGLPTALKLMRPLVDIAIQFSVQRGYGGRLALHAASNKNAADDKALCEKYEKGCKLIPFSAAKRLSGARKNDGRYFYAHEQRALEVSSDLDYLR
jgi:hypothetical protein